MSLLHLLLLSLLLLLLPLLLPFHFSIARIADASHKRRLSTAIASAASASSRELDFLTRATADLESLALGERKPGVGTGAPRMIAECPRAVLPSMSLKHHPRVRTGGPLRSRSPNHRRYCSYSSLTSLPGLSCRDAQQTTDPPAY